jgi:hypothetical protein
MSAAQTQPQKALALDPRIIKIVITIGSTAYTFADDGTGSYLYLTAKGTKFANAQQNECSVEIGNLSADLKNEILTQTSPYANPSIVKTMAVYAGRVSTGYSMMFIGDITNSNVTQPPDVFIKLESKTCHHKKGTVKGRSNKGHFSLISAGVAQDLGLSLNFQATDKYINNFNHNGSVTGQVDKLNDVSSDTCCYVDDMTLIVKPRYVPLPQYVTYVNAQTGMIGIPENTEDGTRIVYLIDNATKLGGAIKLTSTLNPSLNGVYVIYKLGFDVSNRDNAFYYHADSCRVSANGTVNIPADEGGQ